jgi:hypothetical protein
VNHRPYLTQLLFHTFQGFNCEEKKISYPRGLIPVQVWFRFIAMRELFWIGYEDAALGVRPVVIWAQERLISRIIPKYHGATVRATIIKDYDIFAIMEGNDLLPETL